jgi:dihydrofolate synthase/folylpolyglutamate synthase
MVDAALRAAGLRTGRYTSPHLMRLEERFAIDGVPVASDLFESAARDVRTTAESLLARGALAAPPTFFEATTVVAFELYRRTGVDMAVLEVGMGGRLDATNVVSPLAGAITTIDLDHERFLGDTLAQIAFEKAGVIKPGMLVVVGERKPEPAAVIADVCRQQQATYIDAMDGVTVASSFEGGRAVLDLQTPSDRYQTLRLALRGRHQIQNAVVAVRLLEALRSGGVAIPHRAIVDGLATVSWPGRLQVVDVDPTRHLLLDAAHNPAGARSLVAYLAEMHPARLPLVFGAMRDKDVDQMLTLLLPHVSSVVTTQSKTPRAKPADELAAVVRQLDPVMPIDVIPTPAAAVAKAWTRSDTVCVAGSIFLVGEVLAGLPGRTA